MNSNTTKDFYNRFTDIFIKYYGDNFQIYSPDNTKAFLNEQIEHMGIHDGMQLLDVGCGVCGPAIHFAKKRDVYIDCINLSDYQITLAQKKISEARLENKIKIFEMDYHALNKDVLKSGYDIIYLFESLGHTTEYEMVIDQLSALIKKNGILYIKDLFSLNADDEDNTEITEQRKSFYNYKPILLHVLTAALHKNKYKIEFIKQLSVKLNDNKLKSFVKELGFPDGERETGYWLELKAIKC